MAFKSVDHVWVFAILSCPCFCESTLSRHSSYLSSHSFIHSFILLATFASFCLYVLYIPGLDLYPCVLVNLHTMSVKMHSHWGLHYFSVVISNPRSLSPPEYMAMPSHLQSTRLKWYCDVDDPQNLWLSRSKIELVIFSLELFILYSLGR